MKIVNREAFLAMPAGTVYAKYKPCVFDAPNIKDETCGDDWFEVQGISSATFADQEGLEDYVNFCRTMEKGGSVACSFDTICRDGLFEKDQLFAIYEREDLIALIDAFSNALASTYPARP